MHLEVTTEAKYLKSKNIPAMVVFNEFMRRFQEMNYIIQKDSMDMLKNHTLIVNPDNKTIIKILDLYDKNEIDKAKLLISYVHQLALLEQKAFTGKELKEFIEQANKVLALIE